MSSRNVQPNSFAPASLWLRAWAGLIDIGFCSLSLPLFTKLSDHLSAKVVRYFATEALVGEGITKELVSACIVALALVLLILLISWFFGSTLFLSLAEWRFGATPGKYLLGLFVTTEKQRRLSFFRAYYRQSAKFLSGICLGAGFLLVFLTWRKQALHDRLAKCYVSQLAAPRRVYGALVISLFLIALSYPSIRKSTEQFFDDITRIRRSYAALSPIASVAWRIVRQGLVDLQSTPP